MAIHKHALGSTQKALPSLTHNPAPRSAPPSLSIRMKRSKLSWSILPTSNTSWLKQDEDAENRAEAARQASNSQDSLASLLTATTLKTANSNSPPVAASKLSNSTRRRLWKELGLDPAKFRPQPSTRGESSLSSCSNTKASPSAFWLGTTISFRTNDFDGQT